MNLHHFSFENVDKLLAAMHTLKSAYPQICFSVDKPAKQFTVEAPSSTTFDKKLIQILESAGGKMID